MPFSSSLSNEFYKTAYQCIEAAVHIKISIIIKFQNNKLRLRLDAQIFNSLLKKYLIEMTCTGLAEITSLKNLSKAEENVKECCRPLRVETS